MKILVTGAAGFIGQHLCSHLREMEHSVVAVDREDGDLREMFRVETIFDLARPDVVVHLAAKVGRLFGEDDPAETIRDNAVMTTNVACVAGARKVRVAYASTSEVYGDRGACVASEDELYGWYEFDSRWLRRTTLPHNIYGLSKRWGEEACRLYAPRGLTIWRLSMPYGPGLPAGRGRAAVVNFLAQARSREPIPVHRGSERSLCWVGDTVRAMEMTLATRGVWNIGRDDDARPMVEIARIACDLAGAPYELIQEVDAPARQTVVKRLDTGRIRSLGWTPEVELVEGMSRTLSWLESLEVAA